MDIQATISKLQSDIKNLAYDISIAELRCYSWKISAKIKTKVNDDYAIFDWREYHFYKDKIDKLAKQQKINKTLYKLMCTIQKQMPNGSISMAQIREM